MRVRWTGNALSDLARLHDFLAPVNRQAAARTTRLLAVTPARLRTHPRIGEKLEGFDAREVRRIIVGAYEIRYEVRSDEVVVLRVWHTREDR